MFYTIVFYKNVNRVLSEWHIISCLVIFYYQKRHLEQKISTPRNQLKDIHFKSIYLIKKNLLWLIKTSIIAQLRAISNPILRI
jgi:hypothetical protein